MYDHTRLYGVITPIDLRVFVDVETSDSEHHMFVETAGQEQVLRNCIRSAAEILAGYKGKIRLVVSFD